jgi:2-haloacid dehalogenase
VSGLWRLKQRYIIGTLSNGNMALLVDLARHGALPWDVVFSAELARSYKPHPSVYHLPVTLLAAEPAEVMLVAAHAGDLSAAAACGLRTAFVSRPLEHGKAGEIRAASGSFDFRAEHFNHLADLLGA